MNKLLRHALILCSTLLLQDAAYATTIPNTDNPVTFLGPTAKVRYTNRLIDNTAYSLAGELGVKDVAIEGTYAFKLSECQRLKISADYLWQQITYSFFADNAHTWVNRIAAGIAYQYDLGANAMRPQLEINAYGAHAPSNALGFITGVVTNTQGLLPENFNDARRIAGSNALGVSPGFAITFWPGSRLMAGLNYDMVHYNTKYVTNNENAVGFGGTATFNQALTDNLDLGLFATVRQPFNHYDVNLRFARIPLLGAWTVGLFGGYNDGKHTLPDTYNVGVTADYFFDEVRDNIPSGRTTACKQPLSDNMLVFASTPAVYMPQVLAIADNLTVYTGEA